MAEDLPPENFRNFKRKLDRQVARQLQKKTRIDSIHQIHSLITASFQSTGSDADESDIGVSENDVRDNDICNENPDSVPSSDNDAGQQNASEPDIHTDDIDEAVQDDIRQPQEVHSEDDALSSLPSIDSGNSEDDDGQPVRFANEAEKEDYVKKFLRDWATSGGVLSMRKLDSLLHGLHPVFPGLPMSYKTLLDTPTRLDFEELEDGCLLWYKGIATNLNTMLLQQYLELYHQILIDVNMDGLPLSDSSRLKFWPILGRLVGCKNKPFVIAIHFGSSDPNVDSYLHDFVNEVMKLQQEGFRFNNRVYPFSIRHFILDAPARSLIKNCIGHAGYGACEKCTDFGESIDDRLVFLDIDAPLRTDASFLNKDDPIHHTGRSILETAGVGMVSQFRLDSFHLVWHGVFKRLVQVWDTWPGPWKWTSAKRDQMNRILSTVNTSCPQDFCRKPRDIRDWKYYKGTEERRLCLYDGLLVFRDGLPPNVYKHYLLFHAGLYILASPILVKSLCDFANDLLRQFITHSVHIYGKRFVVYNVHSLAHLAKECQDHGELDSFSAFDFENSLKSLKDSLNSCYKPLQQVAYRDSERSKAIPVKLPTNRKSIKLSVQHHYPEETIPGSHFKCIDIDGCELKCDSTNSCFSTVDGDIVILKNIVKRHKTIKLSGFKFNQKKDFYSYPLPSSNLGIYQVSELSQELSAFNIETVRAKCWLMKDGDSFLCVPLLHTVPLL